MNDAEREKLASEANGMARQSRTGGAPALNKASTRETIVRWLQWNDPNGTHLDDLAEQEQLEPYTLDEAWDALLLMVEMNR